MVFYIRNAEGIFTAGFNLIKVQGLCLGVGKTLNSQVPSVSNYFLGMQNYKSLSRRRYLVLKFKKKIAKN